MKDALRQKSSVSQAPLLFLQLGLRRWPIGPVSTGTMALCTSALSTSVFSGCFKRGFAVGSFVAGDSPVTLPELPYGYSALEPFINAEIMELHHGKHHQTYVNNYNSLLGQTMEAKQKQDSQVMPKLNSGLHFNGGGARPTGSSTGHT
jgi:hypothetical protein